MALNSLSPRARRWLLLGIGSGVLGVALLTASVFDLQQVSRFNRDLAAGRYASAAQDDSPQGKFTDAWLKQDKGDYEAAIKSYAGIEHALDESFQRRVRFNMATLYLQRALKIRSLDAGEDTIPLVELAKHHYKTLLRANPTDWPAKYNLEQALKLSPELAEPDIPDDAMPERSPKASAALNVDKALP